MRMIQPDLTQSLGTRRAPPLSVRLRRRLGVLAVVVVSGAVGGGCGNLAASEPTAALVSGMPKCDPSLLHPRIAVGAAAGLPGKLIVYVDGVMACVDDAARVDQLVPQIEGRVAAPPLPGAATPAASSPR